MRIALSVLGSSFLLVSSTLAQVPAEVEACRLPSLAALQERSPSIEHLTFDIQSLAISKANTKV